MDTSSSFTLLFFYYMLGFSCFSYSLGRFAFSLNADLLFPLFKAALKIQCCTSLLR